MIPNKTLSMSHTLLLTILGCCTLLALTFQWKGLKGTTLIAPWCWSVIAIGSIIAIEWLPFILTERMWAGGSTSLRYCAAITTLCPIVSLLGAKRPQHRAWQWIVLSLWVILAMPAARTLFFSHATFHTGILWSWFLLILVGMTVVNYLPTCYWPVGLLVGAAQCCLLANELPGVRSLSAWLTSHLSEKPIRGYPGGAITASVLLFAAAILAQWIARERNRLKPTCLNPIDRLWRDFCSHYGFFWSLRVADRFNGIAKSQNYAIRIRWNGFAPFANEPNGQSGETPPTIEEPMEQTFVRLLTRFVSTGWINKRKGERAGKARC